MASWIKNFAIVSSLWLIPHSVLAASQITLHKFAGFETGYGTYQFEEKLDHKIVFPVASLSAGVAYDRFSFVINASGSLSSATISEEEQVGNGSRRDLDLSAGYQLNKTFSVFAGYKDGVSKLNLYNRDPTAPAGNGNERYEQKGPYLGINLNWAFKDAGKLAFSVAYASLDATNHFVADEIYDSTSGDAFEFDDANGDTNGSSRGFSYTLNYTLPIKGHLLFRTRLRINRYQQDISGQQQDAGTSDIINYSYTDITESSTMLLVGVTIVF